MNRKVKIKHSTYLLGPFVPHINGLAGWHLQTMTTKMILHMTLIPRTIHRNPMYNIAANVA